MNVNLGTFHRDVHEVARFLGHTRSQKLFLLFQEAAKPAAAAAPVAPPQAPAAPPQAPAAGKVDVNSPEAQALKAKVVAQGDKIRQLKKDGATKVCDLLPSIFFDSEVHPFLTAT